MQSNKTIGPVPVLNGDQTIEDWKRILSKLTVGAAAETVVANYIYDPVCDYGTSVTVLRRVLQAWAEIQQSRPRHR
jgi:hypothetical protein